MSSELDKEGLEIAGKAFAQKLRQWWAFDEYQMHVHSWHTREDFCGTILPEALEDFILAYQSHMAGKMKPAEEVGLKFPLSRRKAIIKVERLLAMSAALVCGDVNEDYHQLYSAHNDDPAHDPYEPFGLWWSRSEQHAADESAAAIRADRNDRGLG